MSVDSIPSEQLPDLTAESTGLRGRGKLRRLWLVVPVVLAVAVTVIAIVISGAADQVQPRLSADAAHMQRVLAQIPQHGNMLGSPAARVTVTEFGDLQCPYCDAYTLTLFPLLTSYVQSGQVKMVFRPLTFVGPDSVKAARAAEAAGAQNKLWSFIDAFYYNQGYENSGYVTPAFLRGVGRLVPGLNVSRMMTDMRGLAAMAQVKATAALGRAERVHATPTFIIRTPGRPVERVVGMSTLEVKIQADL